MGRPSKFNITQQKEIINLYLEQKLSTNKIGKIFEASSETIRNILIRNNITIREGKETNKLSTKFTFSKMTNEKAFILGLIYGDGSISNRQDYISITSGDLDLLEKTQKTLGNKFKIKKSKIGNYYIGIIYSHKLCEELYELFKVTNNKSDKLIFPKLEENFYPYFISGYLATDGCISVNKKDKLLITSFYSCAKEFIIDLNKLLCAKTDQKLRTIYERKNIKGHFGTKPLYTLTFNGSKAEKICKYIFLNTDEQNISDRKYNIYKNFHALSISVL